MYNDNNQNNFNNFQGGNNQPPVQPNMGYNPQSMYNQNMGMNQQTGNQPVNMQNYQQPMMNNQPVNMQNYQQPTMNNQPQYSNQGYDANNMVNNGGLFNTTKEIPEGGEDYKKGILGGIVGALIGGIVLILLYQVGKVAVASGIAIAALTLIGYEKMSGGLSKKGLTICVVIMIAAVFVSHTIGMCMMLSSDLEKIGYDVSGFEILKDFSNYWEIMNKNTFWGNLVLNYIFCGIGGFYIIKDKINKLKNS